MEEMNITTFDMEDMNLTTIRMLQKVGHPSYEFFDWKFKAELFVFAENFWPRVRGSSDTGSSSTGWTSPSPSRWTT